jgi:drug/metabolite transporter (DMT)-like permease
VGAIGPAMALLPAGVSPMTVAAARIGMGAVGFVPIVARRRGCVRDLARPGVRRWLVAAVVANLVTHTTFIPVSPWPAWRSAR